MTQKLLTGLLAIVIGVSMLPTITGSIQSAEISTSEETFTATEDDTTEETFSLDNEIEEVNYVEVEGEEISEDDYTVSNSDVTLDADASTTDDEVIISYDFEDELEGAVGSLVDLLPLLFVIVIVAGTVTLVRIRQ